MRKEVEIKIKGTIDSMRLLKLGAEILGHSHQHDTYLKSDHLARVRQEGDHFLFTEKKYDLGQNARVREVSEEIIDPIRAAALIKKYGVLFVICKHRTLFHLTDAIISLDKVEQLGNFIEISAENETSLFSAVNLLGLDGASAIKENYFEMMKAKSLPAWVNFAIRFHERVGELSFGIISGILTTIGVIVGVNAATSSRLSVIASITAIAVADSFADSFSMYVAKKAERGFGKEMAFRHAVATFFAKFFFPFTFLIPFFFFSLYTAVLADIAWGMAVLSVLSAEQAIVMEESVVKKVFYNLGLALAIVVCSAVAGLLIAAL